MRVDNSTTPTITPSSGLACSSRPLSLSHRYVYHSPSIFLSFRFTVKQTNKIKLASGKDLEPFWRLYGVHKQSEVLEILEELRIGKLSAEEADAALPVTSEDDPYKNDPERHPALIVNAPKPFNAEPPGELLHDAGFITPSDIFYVRNHLPVPLIDPVTYRLEVEIENGTKNSISLSLDDIKTKFPHHTVVCATQCAGNRR